MKISCEEMAWEMEDYEAPLPQSSPLLGSTGALLFTDQAR